MFYKKDFLQILINKKKNNKKWSCKRFYNKHQYCSLELLFQFHFTIKSYRCLDNRH